MVSSMVVQTVQTVQTVQYINVALEVAQLKT